MSVIKVQRIEKFSQFLENRKKKFMVLHGGRYSGKCFIQGTKVVMADGRLKSVEDINVNDKVMGIDSKPRNVIETHTGSDDLFLVKQWRGIDYVVNSEHLLTLKRSVGAINEKGELTRAGTYRRPNGRYPSYGDYTTISINDYLKESERWKANFYGYRGSVEFDKKEVRIDPYLLGLWLGDGDSNRMSFTTMDKEIKYYVYKAAADFDMEIRILGEKGKAKSYFITLGNISGRGRFKNPLHSAFTSYNLIKNKHIPDDFLFNSRENRLKLLAGLMDTDGSYEKKGTFSIIQKNKRLAEQIQYLACSLGFFTSLAKVKKGIKKIGFVGEYYRTDIYGCLEEIPVLLPRKKFIPPERRQDPTVSGIKVEPCGSGKYYGFTIEGDGRFFLSDFTIVHNSHSVAQLFIRRLYEEENVKMLVLRKTLPALKITAYQLIIDLLQDYQLPYSLNKSVPMTIKYDDNEILFGSLDDPEKYKSYLGNYLWIEEATELTFDEFLKVSLVMSRKNDSHINQVFLTFNPISCHHWVIKQFVNNPNRSDAAMLHSTHLDNPFLAEDVVQQLNNLINEDDSLYQIYVLGKCGELKNKIYSKYSVGSYPDQVNQIAYGLDYAFNVPTALLETGFVDGQCYERELLYQTHLTNLDLIELLKQLITHRGAPIYADPSEPARIAAIKQAGFNILPANNDVNVGIEFVKSCHPIIDKNSPNLISEKQDYKWQKRNGIVIDKPVKFRDHLMDCERYALYTPSLTEEEREPELVIPRLH